MAYPCQGRLSLDLLFLTVFACVSCISTQASSRGQLHGLLKNEAGLPISNVLVSLMDQSSKEGLPILARSDQLGRLVLKNLSAGTYWVLVKSTQYVARKAGPVEILPGETAVVNLVLQNLLDVDGFGGKNVRIKTLLRTVDQRLIFRYRTGLEKQQNPWYENAVFQVYSSSGQSGDYFRFPGDPAGGATANFALVRTLGVNSDYIFAGQLNSGEDSIWRVKTFIDQSLGKYHSLKLYLGHARIGFQQPSLALLGNPSYLGSDFDFTNVPGTTNILSSGFEERFSWGDAVAFSWGLELDKVRSTYNYSAVNPNAELVLRPVRRARMQLTLASKRPTVQNSVNLQDGRAMVLSDAVKVSWIQNRLEFGTSRHYRGSLAYKLWENSELEVAKFQDQFFGGTMPLLALFPGRSGPEVIRLLDDQTSTQGNRLTLRQNFSENFYARVSYVYGTALSVISGDVAVVFDVEDVKKSFKRKKYDAVFTEFGLLIPNTGTELTALLKFIPNGNPIATLDALSDIYETGNKGLNLFVRQIIPIPHGIMSFLGLDFLNGRQIEALLDIRNLTNEDLGMFSAAGSSRDILLAQSRRSVRGGVTVKF